MASKTPLRSIARLLLVVGGLLLILEAVLQLSNNLRGVLDLAPHALALDALTGALVAILVGVLALVGAGQISNPAWSIILLILGFLVGGLGGILVFIGALIALVATFVK